MKCPDVKGIVVMASLCTVMAVASPLYAASSAASSAGSAKAAAAPAATNTDMQILKDKIKADKKLLVAANMALTEAEAKAFWPIYDAYQKDLAGINKKIGDAVANYAKVYNDASVPDDAAKKITSDMIDVETAETQMRKTYAEKLGVVLPARKVVRYLQIENKIRALVRYELASQIPLLE